VAPQRSASAQPVAWASSRNWRSAAAGGQVGSSPGTPDPQPPPAQGRDPGGAAAAAAALRLTAALLRPDNPAALLPPIRARASASITTLAVSLLAALLLPPLGAAAPLAQGSAGRDPASPPDGTSPAAMLLGGTISLEERPQPAAATAAAAAPSGLGPPSRPAAADRAAAEPASPAAESPSASPVQAGQPQPNRENDDPAAATAVPAPSPQPSASGSDLARELVLDRRRRQLLVLEQGRPLRRFPVAVGMPGWETPVGRFQVIEKQADPVWEHPVSGARFQPGPDNPLGSRWIGFHRDCAGRRGFNGQEHLVVEGCVVSGFHGTPNRDSIGRAVSHGCVRLLDEHIRELFELVELGTPVTVVP